MPAKKPLKAAPVENVGAPAAAKRLEEREAAIWSRIERLEADLAGADAEFAQADGDDEKQKGISTKIGLINKDLMDTQKSWLQLTKQVREFDASIDTSRREGEKILVSEAKEIYRQIFIGSNLAIEAFILKFCQDAVAMDTPEQIYKMSCEAIRQAHSDALEQAKREGVIPKWVYERA